MDINRPFFQQSLLSTRASRGEEIEATNPESLHLQCPGHSTRPKASKIQSDVG